MKNKLINCLRIHLHVKSAEPGNHCVPGNEDIRAEEPDVEGCDEEVGGQGQQEEEDEEYEQSSPSQHKYWPLVTF